MGEKSKVVFSLFGVLDVTGEVIAMWIILALFAIVSLIVKRNLKERPGVFQNMIETGVEYLDNFLTDLLGHERARKYFVFLSSLFIFIITSNYFGLIPGVGLTDYVKAPTASLSVTVGLGALTFIFLQVAGLKCGVKHYFKRFVSPMFFMLPLSGKMRRCRISRIAKTSETLHGLSTGTGFLLVRWLFMSCLQLSCCAITGTTI